MQPQTSSRGLRLRTYAVVPMSCHIGLVGWVDGTLPLKAAIEGQAKARLAAAVRQQLAPPLGTTDEWGVGHNDAAFVRNNWIKRFGKSPTELHKPLTYVAMYQKASSDEVRAFGPACTHALTERAHAGGTYLGQSHDAHAGGPAALPPLMRCRFPRGVYRRAGSLFTLPECLDYRCLCCGSGRPAPRKLGESRKRVDRMNLIPRFALQDNWLMTGSGEVFPIVRRAVGRDGGEGRRGSLFGPFRW